MIIDYDFKDNYHNAIQVVFMYYERCYVSVSPIKIDTKHNSYGVQFGKDYKGFRINLNEDFMKRKNTKKLEKLNTSLEKITKENNYNFIDIVLNQDIDEAKRIIQEVIL